MGALVTPQTLFLNAVCLGSVESKAASEQRGVWRRQVSSSQKLWILPQAAKEMRHRCFHPQATGGCPREGVPVLVLSAVVQELRAVLYAGGSRTCPGEVLPLAPWDHPPTPPPPLFSAGGLTSPGNVWERLLLRLTILGFPN